MSQTRDYIQIYHIFQIVKLSIKQQHTILISQYNEIK